MKKAETVDHYIVNIKLFVEDLIKHAPDPLSVELTTKGANRVIEGRKISQMKALLAEYERMYLEDDIQAYREMMEKVNKYGYAYGNPINAVDDAVEEVIRLNKISSGKQYRSALLYIEMNYENEANTDKIEVLNRLLAAFETRRSRKR